MHVSNTTTAITVVAPTELTRYSPNSPRNKPTKPTDIFGVVYFVPILGEGTFLVKGKQK